MRIFGLSLPSRLALAALSGALSQPTILLGEVLDRIAAPPILEWWVILHGVLFGALVMTPFILSQSQVAVRTTAMIIASVLAYLAAIELPDIIGLPFGGEVGAFSQAGVIGAVLVAIAVRIIAPLKIHTRYWGLTLLAGAIGGAIFSQTFGVCVLDSCESLAEFVAHSFGWVAWQMLVCAALWLGVRHDRQDIVSAGV